MRIDDVTLFPEMIRNCCQYGIPRIAVEKGLLQLATWNPRDYASNRHRNVDDRPYGGGPGMLMKIQPLRDAIHAAREAAPGNPCVVYLSPQGETLNQTVVESLAAEERLILVAGRYEGVDERLITTEVDREVSLGDFVLSGGELAAMAVIDAVTRLIPGALGHAQSAEQDSFADGLLDCPHYTRPEIYEGQAVPDVLLGGHHDQIRRWRLKQSLRRTRERRPDLLEKRVFTDEERELLEEILNEPGASE